MTSISLIRILITSFLLYSSYRKFKNTSINAVKMLFVFFCVDLTATLYEFVSIVINPSQLIYLYLALDKPFTIIFSSLGMIAAGIFLIFINFYINDRYSITHVAVISILTTAFMTYNFLKLYNLTFGSEIIQPILTHTPLSFDFIPAILITYLIIVAYPQLINLFKQSNNKTQKKTILGLLLTLFFFFVIPSIFITIGWFYNFDEINTVILTTVIPRISVIIGGLLFLLSYFQTSSAFLQNQNIEKLIVITPSGIPIYSLDFFDTNEIKDDNILLSGSLTALKGLLAETIKVSELESINFKEKVVLVRNYQHVGYFLISDRPSKFLRNALRSSAEEINLVINGDKSKTQILSEEILDENLDRQILSIFGIVKLN
jgi:hypothetical protein